MRKLGIAIAVIVVLLVAAVLIVPHLIDVNQYHGQVQSQLEKRLGRPVTLGNMRLRLFPPAFDVDNATIAEDPHFATNRPFATADKLAVSVKFWPLLQKQLDVNSLELVHPHIELVRNAEGVWNFATLGQESKPTAAQKVPPHPTPSTSTGPDGKQPAGQLTLANLFINDGQVAITDLQKHQSRAVYDHIDLNVGDYAPDQQFSMKLTAHLPGEGKQSIGLEGKGGPIKEADMLNTPFDGTLRLEQVSTGAAQKFLNLQSLKGIDAVLTGNARVKNSAGKLASSGTMKMENARIHNVNVGYPIALDYDVADDLTNDVIQIHKGDVKLGATPVSLAGTVNTKPNPVQIDLNLRASNASIAEMARLASAFGVAFGKDVDVKGQINATIQVRGAMDKPVVTGQLSARSLDISGKEIPQPVKVNEMALTLTPDAVRSNEFAATTGSTTVNVSFAISQYSAPNSSISATLRAPNARIEEILNIAKAAGVSAVDGITGDGALSLDIKAQGPTKNLSALNFEGTGKISNATLKMPSLQPVKVNEMAMTLTSDSVRSNEFAATTGSTTVNVSFALSHYRAPNGSISATLRAPNARIGEILNIAKAAGVSAVDGISGDGALSLDVKAQGPTKNLSALNFDGTGKISNATLTVPSLTKPLQIKNSDIRFSQNSASLGNLAVTVGQTNASGALTLKNFEAPEVQFTLNADKVNVVELRQIFAATPAQPAKHAGFWQLVPEANAQATNGQMKTEPSMLSKMTGGGTLTVGLIQYDDLLLNNVHSNVTLDHGLIKMNPVTADLYNGKENGTITIDMRPAQPVYAVNLKTDKVDANKLISSVSDVKQTLYGQLASNVNASFSTSSASTIARNLNGNMAIDLSNGRLMNIDLLHELATVGKFAGNGFGPPKNFTDLAQLTGNFDVKNGLAQTNNLKAVIDGGTLAAAGLVNLADQTLNLHVTAVLNKAYSQQVGGSQVGGYMNTALANNQGELVLPVIVTGTFQHPQVAPDVQQIAKMKLNNLLPTSNNPGQLTTGILGAVLGNKNQNGNSGGANQQKGGIGGILDAIGGKQQQQHQNQQPASPAVGNNQGQQPQATATPTPAAPNLGDVLGQVLNRKKKDQATPTPTPPQ